MDFQGMDVHEAYCNMIHQLRGEEKAVCFQKYSKLQINQSEWKIPLQKKNYDFNKSCIALIRTQIWWWLWDAASPPSVCLRFLSSSYNQQKQRNMFGSRHAMSVWCFTPSSGIIKTETEKEMEDKARERQKGMAPIMSRRPGGRGIGYRVILQGRWQKGWEKAGCVLVEGLLMSVKQIEGNNAENMNINVARSRMSVYSRWDICSDVLQRDSSLKNENVNYPHVVAYSIILLKR